jgi:hypothetical protein
MPRVKDTPESLRPFVFHGVDLRYTERSTQAIAECPFCGKEGKFYVSMEDGQWDCKVCGQSGNHIGFIRQLWEGSTSDSDNLKVLAHDRSCLQLTTPQAWDIRRSVITGEWIIPAYGVGNKLDQLYVYRPDHKNKHRLIATAGLGHALHGVPLYDNSKQDVYLVEGIWNAMCLWEIMRQTKVTEDGYEQTGNEESSLYANANILAVPGANVFSDYWIKLLEDKRVFLCYDSDQPRQHPQSGAMIEGSGPAAVKRVVKILSGKRNGPSEVHYLCWGPEGYDLDRPSGWDIRDHLKQGSTVKDRAVLLGQLLEKMQTVPTEWIPGSAGTHVENGQVKPKPRPCDSWDSLLKIWKGALSLRQDLQDTLATMLSVALSTPQKGDGQLFLQVIADAGSAKTKFCDAMLIAEEYCHPLEHITGLYSGWMGGGKDFSLLSRINLKTLITPEGDVMMSSPKFSEIMSQFRRIFDGSGSASYKNRDEELKYEALRTPWILAGTPALLDYDQSRLGDRFIRIRIEKPDKQGIENILDKVGLTAWGDAGETVNPEAIAGETMNGNMLHAYQCTGGYINWLRGNVQELTQKVQPGKGGLQRLNEYCKSLSKFTACLRAKQNPKDIKNNKTSEASYELPTRLHQQFIRLSRMLAAVLNKYVVDDEVLRIVGKVAKDTAHGNSMKVVHVLYNSGSSGMELSNIASLTHHRENEDKDLLYFMRKIEAVEEISVSVSTSLRPRRKWRLMPHIRDLYEELFDA